jgi:G3E family GTPase
MSTFEIREQQHNNSNKSSFSCSSFSRLPPSKLFSTTSSSSSSQENTASSSSSSSSSSQSDATKQVPVTLLAGFLGSGKTTTLQNLLSNNQGIKIGIIVNDVASVNIDNKLLANPNYSSEETVELQNGCACCSLADELLSSVEKLMAGGRDLDAIVVELSGVADPVQVKENWREAVIYNHPVTKIAKMDKVVTLVDSSTFGTDWMTWDTFGEKMVPELLAEQVEAADILVINKIDLAGEEQVAVASSLARVMNQKAGIFETKFGEISVREVLQVNEQEQQYKDHHDHDHGHDHGHEEEEVVHGAEVASCNQVDGKHDSHNDSKHSHHSHSHNHNDVESCNDPGCTDKSHSHDHNHQGEACSDPGCTDATHSHSHDHQQGEVCNDPGCTDPSHNHSQQKSTSTANLGIRNFVYKSNRPFNMTRLLNVLNKWPVPIKEELDLGQLAEAAEKGFSVDDEGNEQKSPFVGILRSKGFCWMAPTRWTGEKNDIWRHNTAMYWSHAGKHFGISTAGKWWGSISKEEMKSFFGNNMKEYERILQEDFVSEEFGDRRQEIVFIGVNIDEEEITKALDDCLCSDEEMEVYRQQLRTVIDA